MLVGTAAALVMGVPTGIVETSFYHRMTPVTWWDYRVWAPSAEGCPICNKLVVSLIGVSGALSYWAPLQPVLEVPSIELLTTGLVVPLRGAIACRVPAMADLR